jgi:hypothetical protein
LDNLVGFLLREETIDREALVSILGPRIVGNEVALPASVSSS